MPLSRLIGSHFFSAGVHVALLATYTSHARLLSPFNFIVVVHQLRNDEEKNFFYLSIVFPRDYLMHERICTKLPSLYLSRFLSFSRILVISNLEFVIPVTIHLL
jgi:hypothetical protein